VIGGKFLGVREMLDASTQETRNYVEQHYAATQQPDRKFQGFDTTWPAYEPHATAGPEPVEGGAAPPHADKPKEATHHAPNDAGWHLVHTIVFWAFIVGIGLGTVIYWNGYWIAAPLTGRGPLALVRVWLYRRMYFDELYLFVFVGITMGLSRFSEWFDRKVIDQWIVGNAAKVVRWSSHVAGMHDKYVVDGAVDGMARLTQNVGAAVRAPQSGRIRMYVTILMAAVALGLAGAIIVALS
jgi:NADH:ubiquinone oxidoreductase subunit 5 (subunit L)/multisubunit Na+/H+ antiporter MnhA subunit